MKKLFLIIVLSSVLRPAFSQENEREKIHQLGFGRDIIPTNTNYPDILFFVDYTYDKDFVLAMGVGPVLVPEMFQLDDVTAKVSYNGFLEFKWYPKIASNRIRPFLGGGYEYMNSKFETEYITKNGEFPHHYFINNTVELQTTISKVYIPLGVRFNFYKDIIYMETSFRLQHVNKHVDWSEEFIGGELVSNESIAHVSTYRSPFILEHSESSFVDDYNISLMFNLKFGFKFYAF